MTDLSRKRDRERLKPRPAPYFQRLDKGRYLGFRRAKVYDRSTWLVRLRDRDGQQHPAPLPNIHVDDFDGAKKAAEKWLKQIGSAPVLRATRGTVKDGLQCYLTWLEDQNREATAKNARPKFRKVVWDDPLATIPLHALTREDMNEWRKRLRKGRQPRSINRIVRDVQAGLNRALKEGFAGNPQAWALDPLADDVEEVQQTTVFLSAKQRKAIIDAALPAAADFLRGLDFTGARPGELAAATVADLDARNGTVRMMHRKGRPAKLRPRMVVLSSDGVTFFSQQARHKLPAARLFLDPDGMPWHRKRWAEEFRAAAAIVNVRAKGKNRIPPGASAYGFRHARISELLQVHQIDPLSVASQTGTSLSMIEKYYFEFIPSALKDKLKAVQGADR
jgi:integrase